MRNEKSNFMQRKQCKAINKTKQLSKGIQVIDVNN